MKRLYKKWRHGEITKERYWEGRSNMKKLLEGKQRKKRVEEEDRLKKLKDMGIYKQMERNKRKKKE